MALAPRIPAWPGRTKKVVLKFTPPDPALISLVSRSVQIFVSAKTTYDSLALAVRPWSLAHR